MCFERKFTNDFIKTKILTVFIDEDLLPVVAFMVRTSLRQEIFIRICGKVRCCAGLAAEGFAVTDLLQVVQPTGDALVAVGVESVEVDDGTTVHTGVNLGAGQVRIAVSVYDSGSRSGVGIDEVAASVSRIIRTLGVAVTERRLDSGERRYGATVALELGLTFLIGRLSRRLDLLNGHGVSLRNNEADAELRGAAVDGFGLPDIGVGPRGSGRSSWHRTSGEGHESER